MAPGILNKLVQHLSLYLKYIWNKVNFPSARITFDRLQLSVISHPTLSLQPPRPSAAALFVGSVFIGHCSDLLLLADIALVLCQLPPLCCFLELQEGSLKHKDRNTYLIEHKTLVELGIFCVILVFFRCGKNMDIQGLENSLLSFCKFCEPQKF